MESSDLEQRDWISIEDPTEDRTWLFDASFLASNWTCIYGRGCRGIETEPDVEGMRGCCSHGAYLADTDDELRVLNAIGLLGPEHWQRHASQLEAEPLYNDSNGSRRTRTVDGACIFLNSTSFHRGAGCAFHVLASDQDRPFVETKPEVCWQVPIRREDVVEESGHVVSQVRPWRRRDWGEGASEFDWWCIDESEAFIGTKAAYMGLEHELIAIAGQKVYDLLCMNMRRREGTILAHPVRRSAAQ